MPVSSGSQIGYLVWGCSFSHGQDFIGSGEWACPESGEKPDFTQFPLMVNELVARFASLGGLGSDLTP